MSHRSSTTTPFPLPHQDSNHHHHHHHLLYFPQSTPLSRASSPHHHDLNPLLRSSAYPNPPTSTSIPWSISPTTTTTACNPHDELQAIKRDHQLQAIKRHHHLELERLRLQARELQEDKALLTARTVRLERELSHHQHCNTFEPHQSISTFSRSRSRSISSGSLAPPRPLAPLSTASRHPTTTSSSAASPHPYASFPSASTRTSLPTPTDHHVHPRSLAPHQHSRSTSSCTSLSLSRPVSPAPSHSSIKGILKNPRRPAGSYHHQHHSSLAENRTPGLIPPGPSFERRRSFDSSSVRHSRS